MKLVFISFFFCCFVSFGGAMNISQDGDYIIEFILSIHDGDRKENGKSLMMTNVLAVEAIISTIEKINRDRGLLPNITLGYIIHDDNGSKRLATEITMSLMERILRNEYTEMNTTGRGGFQCRPTGYSGYPTDEHKLYGKPVIAVVGGTTSDIAMRIATVLRPIGIPIINYMATSDRLRRVNAYPYFVNLLPSDKYQAKAILDLTDKFKWSYVLAVASTSYYGLEGLAMLEKEAAKRTICLHSQTILIPIGDNSNNTSIRKAIQQIKRDKRLRVVIVFMYLDDVKRLFQEVERQNVTGITWIASEAWAENTGNLNFPPRSVVGSLGVKLVSRRSGANKRQCRDPNITTNIWLIPFLCQLQNINSSNCSLSSLTTATSPCVHSFFPKSVMYLWSLAASAVHTIAQALNGLVSEKTFDYGAMLKSIKSSYRAVGNTNYVGPSVVKYAIVNLQSANGRLKFVQVGSWAKDLSKVNSKKNKLVLKKTLQWNTGQVPQSRCSKPCQGGYKTNQGPRKCCWLCTECLPGHITNSDKPHLCIKCNETEHPGPNRNQCVADTQVFFKYNTPIGIALLTACSFGEVLGFALFATLRRWSDHMQYTVMPYRELSFVITVVGFLQPLAHLLQTSLPVCHLRIISLFFFVNTHACFLFCSCGKVRLLVVRLHAHLTRVLRRRQKKTALRRKTWTRSMRLQFVKERELERRGGGGESEVNDGGVRVRKPYETEGGEITERREDRMNRRCKDRHKLERAEPTDARKIPASEEDEEEETKVKVEVKVKVEDVEVEEMNDARTKHPCRVTPAFVHHALFFVALFFSCLWLPALEHDNLVNIEYVKLKDTEGYRYCTFGNPTFFPIFTIFHFLHLVLTLALANPGTKTIPAAERNSGSKGDSVVDVSLFYVHDAVVYNLSYLILLIESICIPFFHILPGPQTKDLLTSIITIVIQYSFVLTTYGTKLYVICREQYKNK